MEVKENNLEKGIFDMINVPSKQLPKASGYLYFAAVLLTSFGLFK